jgi:predicted N-acetyltransferase YhbS
MSDQVTSRPYQGEADFEKVRRLLVESYTITDRIHNWWLDRWESCRFGGYAEQELTGDRLWEADTHLWETEDGTLVGVVTPEGAGNAFLQVHPDYARIEAGMLAWAEKRHRAARPEKPLNTYAYEYDLERAEVLRDRGYEDMGRCEYTRWRYLDAPIPQGGAPEGYVVRDLVGATQADLAGRAAVLNAAFGSTTNTAELMDVLRRAPTYRADLDIVVVAPDGSTAAMCGVWYGEENRMGWFEPVATHPAHHRRGLATAAMSEGLRRLRALGATRAYVGSGYGAPANRLYESLGFTAYEIWHHWVKSWEAPLDETL